MQIKHSCSTYPNIVLGLLLAICILPLQYLQYKERNGKYSFIDYYNLQHIALYSTKYKEK